MGPTKPGVATSELWVTVATTLWAVVAPFVPAASPLHTIVPVAAGAVYTIARTVLKAVATLRAQPAPPVSPAAKSFTG